MDLPIFQSIHRNGPNLKNLSGSAHGSSLSPWPSFWPSSSPLLSHSPSFYRRRERRTMTPRSCYHFTSIPRTIQHGAHCTRGTAILFSSTIPACHRSSNLNSRLQAQPGLNFSVIVNPSSGPGSSQYPSDQYAAALTQLSTYPNVQKIGYVRTGYATRNLSDVITELNTYAGWAAKNHAFAIDGIFFDEAPHEYTADAVDWMLKASQAVKSAKGFQRSKTVCYRFSCGVAGSLRAQANACVTGYPQSRRHP